jgi:hypothetical protein
MTFKQMTWLLCFFREGENDFSLLSSLSSSPSPSPSPSPSLVVSPWQRYRSLDQVDSHLFSSFFEFSSEFHHPSRVWDGQLSGGISISLSLSSPLSSWWPTNLSSFQINNWEPFITGSGAADIVFFTTQYGEPPCDEGVPGCPDPSIVFRVSHDAGVTYVPFHELNTFPLKCLIFCSVSWTSSFSAPNPMGTSFPSSIQSYFPFLIQKTHSLLTLSMIPSLSLSLSSLNLPLSCPNALLQNDPVSAFDGRGNLHSVWMDQWNLGYGNR